MCDTSRKLGENNKKKPSRLGGKNLTIWPAALLDAKSILTLCPLLPHLPLPLMFFISAQSSEQNTGAGGNPTITLLAVQESGRITG